MFCQRADQLIQKVKVAESRQPAAQHNPKHRCSSGLIKCFSVTRALITFLQLVNPLVSFLCVLHASCSIFIKGISS